MHNALKLETVTYLNIFIWPHINSIELGLVKAYCNSYL